MSVFDLSGAIGFVPQTTFTIERLLPTVFSTAGRASTPARAPSDAVGSVQPTSGADLKRMGEGFHSATLVTVYTTTELRQRDRLQLPDGPYEVERSQPWGTTASYWKAIARKLTASEAAL